MQRGRVIFNNMNTIEKHNNKELQEQILKDYTENILKLKEIAKKYNISLGFINNLIKRNNIEPRKKHNYYIINIELFNNINSKEVAYLLGLLWADGNLHKNKAKIYFNMNDYLSIKYIFDKCGLWSQWINQKDIGNKTRIEISSGDKQFREFLKNNDYLDKSIINPTKILSVIPKNLHNYFLLGFFDGDGCFSLHYKNSKLKCYYFALAGSYEQDWSWIIQIFNELNLKIPRNTVRQFKTTIGRGSQVRTANLENLIKIGKFMYKNGFEIGFPRKFEIFKVLENAYNDKIKLFHVRHAHTLN